MTGPFKQQPPAHPGTGPLRPDERDEIQLLEYWRVLVRRRVVVLACLAAVVLATVVYSFLATPEYLATATVQIERQGPDILTFKDVLSVDAAGYQDFYQTQYKILQSRAVLRLAVERIDLVNRPEYAGRTRSPASRVKSRVAALFAAEEPDGDAQDGGMSEAVEFLAGGLSIQPVRKSHLVRVSFLDRDPELASEIADAVVEAYQQFNLEARYSTTAQASEFLTKQVAELQAEITEKERRLQEYRVEKNILDVRDDTEGIASQALAALNGQHVAAKGRLALAEARFVAVRDSTADALPEVMKSPLIAQLRQQHAEIERRHSRMSERFRPDWPALRELAEALDTASDRLESETRTIAHQVRSVAEADYEKARAEVRFLARRLDEQKSEVQQIEQETVEYAGLKAEIETQRDFLDDLLNRQSQTEISDRLRDTQTSNIRLVDRAQPPERPLKPRKLKNLAGSLLVGLLFGVGMALLFDHLDYTVKNEQEIERLSGLSVLGRIPLFQPLKVVGEGDAAAGAPDPVGLGSHLDPRSSFAEAFKTLRTSILLASADRPPRQIVVTSCEPGDGKSTVATNLAIALSQLGRRVLLLDADLRNPTVHKMMGISNRAGLANLLTGNAKLQELLRESDVPNLRTVTSGPIPPTPSELLGSPALQALLDRSGDEGEFDHIIIDCPPSLQVTDSVILATRTDATVFVVRAGKTSREALAQGASRLRQARAHVVGVVMNALHEEGAGYYYGPYRRQPDGEDAAREVSAGPLRRKRKRGA